MENKMLSKSVKPVQLVRLKFYASKHPDYSNRFFCFDNVSTVQAIDKLLQFMYAGNLLHGVYFVNPTTNMFHRFDRLEMDILLLMYDNYCLAKDIRRSVEQCL